MRGAIPGKVDLVQMPSNLQVTVLSSRLVFA